MAVGTTTRNLLAEWLRALRSGEYSQTNGVLYREGGEAGPDGFCCLGVAADALFGAKWDSPDKAGARPLIYFDGEYTGRYSSNLPYTLSEALGLEHRLGDDERLLLEAVAKFVKGVDRFEVPFGPYTREDACMWMNDKVQLNFNQIADVFKHMRWDERV